MIVRILVLCYLLGSPLAVASVKEGNEALEAGQFAESVDFYTQAIKENGPGVTALYNLGNAHYRLGEFGLAILAYERALLIDPRAPDIRANLELARDAAASFDESEKSDWTAPLHWLSLDEWLFIGAASLVVLAVLCLVAGLFLTKSKALRWPIIVGAAILLLCLAVISLRYSEFDRAIVLRPDAEVRLSPFPTADVVATLKAGQPVQLEKEHDGFYRVANGWISANDAELVYPDR